MSDKTKECVACAEEIKEEAKLCRFCGTHQGDKKYSTQNSDGADVSETEARVEEYLKPKSPLPLPSDLEKNPKLVFFAVFGIIAALGTIAALVFAGSPDTAQTVSQSIAPEDNEGLAFQPLREGDIPYTSLSPGMCLNDLDTAEGIDREGIPGANCSGPHDSEVTKIGTVPSTVFPISDSVADQIWELCEEGFDEHTGLTFSDEPDWSISFFHPSKREWDNGDRIFACVVYRTDGAKKTGSMGANSQSSNQASGDLSVREIYEKILPSVVTVECGQWQGTGFAYNIAAASGFNSVIVTNHHVIEDCTFSDGPNVEIITSDNSRPNSELWNWDTENDLAIIMTSEILPTIEDAPEADIGDQVVAIGSPLGFSGTITTGIVSQVYSDAYQTDAAINPGNSGGPLLDMRGRLLGVNTLGFGREGLNIAFRPDLLCENVLNCG